MKSSVMRRFSESELMLIAGGLVAIVAAGAHGQVGFSRDQVIAVGAQPTSLKCFRVTGSQSDNLVLITKADPTHRVITACESTPAGWVVTTQTGDHSDFADLSVFSMNATIRLVATDVYSGAVWGFNWAAGWSPFLGSYSSVPPPGGSGAIICREFLSGSTRPAIVAASMSSSSFRSRANPGNGCGGFPGIDSFGEFAPIQTSSGPISPIPSQLSYAKLTAGVSPWRELVALARGANAVQVYSAIAYQDGDCCSSGPGCPHPPGGVSFQWRSTLGELSGPVATEVADFDGDGIDDLAVACSTDATLRIFRGDGIGDLLPWKVIGLPSRPTSLAVGLLDANGTVDIAVVCGNQSSGELDIFANQGGGLFTLGASIPTVAQPSSVAIGQLAGDNRPDIAVACSGDSSVTIYRNTGVDPCGGSRSWAQRATTGPSKRFVAAAAFDIDRGKALLFGGGYNGGPTLQVYNDLWEWDGFAWTIRQPNDPTANNRPRPTWRAAMAYDTVAECCYMFGGNNDLGQTTNQFWRLDPSTEVWTNLSTLVPASMKVRKNHSMVYDRIRHVCVLYGGSDDQNAPSYETWEFNGAQWNLIGSPTNPGPRVSAGMAFDPIRGKTVVFGGGTEAQLPTADRPWEWDGASWAPVGALSATPAPRYGPGFACDESRGRIVMTGGATLAISNEVWELGSSGWSSQGTIAGMVGRAGHAMFYDATRRAVVAYGGLNQSLDYETDTWALSYSGPQITGQPQDQSVIAGQAATFSVVTTTNSQSVQWFKDGLVIAGENNLTLLISSVQRVNAGKYAAIVRFDCGTEQATSIATLTVRSCCGPSFSGLGVVPGTLGQTATALSGDGKTVIGSVELPGGGVAWRSTESGNVFGGPPFSDPTAVSYDGSVLVGHNASGSVWWKDTGETLPILPTANWTSAYVLSLSRNGGTAAGYLSLFDGQEYHQEAFRWTVSGGTQFVGTIAGYPWCAASAVSGDGSTLIGFVGGSSVDRRAMRWSSQSGMLSLGTLSPTDIQSYATDSNGDGSVVVGMVQIDSVNNYRAFRWTAMGGMASLGVPSGDQSSSATAVNGSGDVVVGYSRDPAYNYKAFIYRSGHGISDLSVLLTALGINLAGWELTGALDVSEDGQTILGYGRHYGIDEYWLATITPAPCYANCDNSTAPPILNANDFQCFLNKFASADAYANCDNSTAPPILNANDFQCFLNKFAAGCP